MDTVDNMDAVRTENSSTYRNANNIYARIVARQGVSVREEEREVG